MLEKKVLVEISVPAAGKKFDVYKRNHYIL